MKNSDKVFGTTRVRGIEPTDGDGTVAVRQTVLQGKILCSILLVVEFVCSTLEYKVCLIAVHVGVLVEATLDEADKVVDCFWGQRRSGVGGGWDRSMR